MDKSNQGFSVLAGFPLNDWSEPWVGNFTVFPRSHKLIYKALKEDKEGTYSMMRLESDGDRERKKRLVPEPPVQIIARPGDAILAHPLLAHRAGPNHSVNIRYAVYMRVRVEGEQFVEVEPNSNMLRV